MQLNWMLVPSSLRIVPGRGFRGIGCAHRVAPFRDRVFRFEHDHDGFPGAHEIRQLAKKRPLAVNRVKSLGFFFVSRRDLSATI